MVDLALLQSVSYIAGALGVCVAAVYYVMNLRITQKNQELSLKALEQSAKAQELNLKTQELALKTQQQNLETRQAQLFMQILLVNQSKEMVEFFTKLYSTDLSDAKGIVERGFVKGEAEMQELMQLVGVICTHYDGIGVYTRKGLIDIDMVKELLSGDYIMMWEKLRPLVMEIRKSTAYTVENFEWLYERLKSMKGQPSSLNR